MSPQYGIVYTTASSREEAATIASALVEAKLAACIKLFPVHSLYIWQGQVESQEEWQLMIKTDLNQWEAIETKLKSLHSYEVPELVAVPIVKGSAPYLEWIGEQTS